MQISEKLLVEAGGWQALKHARGLHSAGRVSEAKQEGEVLHGFVREGDTRYRAGLRILSRTNIENLCTCRDSRLRGAYPQIDSIQLADYKVRIINGQAGTAARTRVLITSTDGHDSWGTVGVSDNIIEASWLALVDGLEYRIGRSRG